MQVIGYNEERRGRWKTERKKKEKRKNLIYIFFFLTYKKIFFFYQNHDDQKHMTFFILGKFFSKHDYNDLLQWILKSRITLSEVCNLSKQILFFKKTKNIFL